MKEQLIRIDSSRMRTVGFNGHLVGVASGSGECLHVFPCGSGDVHPGRHPLCRHPWADTYSETPPRTELLTHACENITFPQLLLRMVIRIERKNKLQILTRSAGAEKIILTQRMAYMRHQNNKQQQSVHMNLLICVCDDQRIPNVKIVSFSRTHKIDNIAIIANFVFPYLQCPSLFATYGISKCRIRCQLMKKMIF